MVWYGSALILHDLFLHNELNIDLYQTGKSGGGLFNALMKESCLKRVRMGVVTFLAREMLVRDWLDLWMAGPASTQPLQLQEQGGRRRGRAASQQINLGGGGRAAAVPWLASPWRWSPQTLSLAGFHLSSVGAGGSSGKRRRRPAAAAALEEEKPQSECAGGGEATVSRGGKSRTGDGRVKVQMSNTKLGANTATSNTSVCCMLFF